MTNRCSLADQDLYRNKLRNRACAVIVSDEYILLAKHNSPTREEPIWMPPGGGIQFGEPAKEALIREVKEETGLIVEPIRLIWIHEFLEDPYHAIEFYFECSIAGGALKLGEDPEHTSENQILLDLKFIPFKETGSISLYPSFLKESCKNNGKLPENILHVITSPQV
ncbi:MAG: NUDIX domain-containing protein [Balneolaceae bacterium]|nr:MAG: NUDIX domain-containing protein [Balneolaceae bacterium]